MHKKRSCALILSATAPFAWTGEEPHDAGLSIEPPRQAATAGTIPERVRSNGRENQKKEEKTDAAPYGALRCDRRTGAALHILRFRLYHRRQQAHDRLRQRVGAGFRI